MDCKKIITTVVVQQLEADIINSLPLSPQS